MTTPSGHTLPNKSSAASWAQVIEASASTDGQAQDVSAAAESDALPLGAGDLLVDAKFGRCTIHRISEGVIHMAKENGRVIRVRADMLSIRPLGVETLGNNNHRRVFTTSTEQL